MKRHKPIHFIEDWSESAWKSAVVKSLRLGWPAGLEAAASRLSPSTVQQLLVCGVFEDIFPAKAELAKVMVEVKARDWPALCIRQTHHGRGYTQRFCELEPIAVSAAENEKGKLWAAAREYKLWLPNRALNCWWTWLEIGPQDSGVLREPDGSPWAGMPAAMLDGHTYEGRRARTPITVLSGHYCNHLSLSQLVAKGGWQAVRTLVHLGGLGESRCHAMQGRLF
jgi:hypothetical protein